MRPIKFRFWEEKSKAMIDWLCVRQTALNRGDMHMMYDMMGTNPEIVKMQFVGLLDKNRIEIYESDICKGPNGKHWVIEWIGHSWCMTNEIIPNGRMKFGGEETYTIDKWLALPPRKQSLEVIGNIFENPELLNNL